jgi:hypothetical protein
MAIYVLKTPEGKVVKVNTEKDECVYSAPRNPPNTGTAYTRGSDLYIHLARSGQRYFYVVKWSMWQGDEGSVHLVDEEEARNFLIDKAGLTGWARLTESEMERVEELFPGIFDETA